MFAILNHNFTFQEKKPKIEQIELTRTDFFPTLAAILPPGISPDNLHTTVLVFGPIHCGQPGKSRAEFV